MTREEEITEEEMTEEEMTEEGKIREEEARASGRGSTTRERQDRRQRRCFLSGKEQRVTTSGGRRSNGECTRLEKEMGMDVTERLS